MIKYNLKCQNDHEFESWFSNSQEFDKLLRKNLLECIYCSSKKIKKSIMSPMISSSKTRDETIEVIDKNLKEPDMPMPDKKDIDIQGLMARGE